MIKIACVLILLFVTACLPEKKQSSEYMDGLGKCNDCAISKPILEE